MITIISCLLTCGTTIASRSDATIQIKKTPDANRGFICVVRILLEDKLYIALLFFLILIGALHFIDMSTPNEDIAINSRFEIQNYNILGD